jgi:hypothetical protein
MYGVCTEYPPFILPFAYLQPLILLGFWDISTLIFDDFRVILLCKLHLTIINTKNQLLCEKGMM